MKIRLQMGSQILYRFAAAHRASLVMFFPVPFHVLHGLATLTQYPFPVLLLLMFRYVLHQAVALITFFQVGVDHLFVLCYVLHPSAAPIHIALYPLGHYAGGMVITGGR